MRETRNLIKEIETDYARLRTHGDIITTENIERVLSQLKETLQIVIDLQRQIDYMNSDEEGRVFSN